MLISLGGKWQAKLVFAVYGVNQLNIKRAHANLRKKYKLEKWEKLMNGKIKRYEWSTHEQMSTWQTLKKKVTAQGWPTFGGAGTLL